jgi:hypothetical protein
MLQQNHGSYSGTEEDKKGVESDLKKLKMMHRTKEIEMKKSLLLELDPVEKAIQQHVNDEMAMASLASIFLANR